LRFGFSSSTRHQGGIPTMKVTENAHKRRLMWKKKLEYKLISVVKIDIKEQKAKALCP
jgi:hypothetical protein